MTDSLDILLPQITSEEFSRSWIRFELFATAKEWNAAKQLAVVPTLLHGKLINCYLDLSEDDKKDVKTLRTALQEKAGLKRDPLMASKLFNERVQGPQEKASDFVSELRKLFQQAFPEEEATSAVLLQRYLTGLRPTISRQMLLRRKPKSFPQAITDAIEVKLALSFGTIAEADTGSTGVHTVAANPLIRDDSVTKLQQTLEAVSKRLEQLESKLQDAPYAQERPRNPRGRRYNQRAGSGDGRCFLCHEEGLWKRDCPLNFEGPAGRVGRWPTRNLTTHLYYQSPKQWVVMVGILVSIQ